MRPIDSLLDKALRKACTTERGDTCRETKGAAGGAAAGSKAPPEEGADEAKAPRWMWTLDTPTPPPPPLGAGKDALEAAAVVSSKLRNPSNLRQSPDLVKYRSILKRLTLSSFASKRNVLMSRILLPCGDGARLEGAADADADADGGVGGDTRNFTSDSTTLFTCPM